MCCISDFSLTSARPFPSFRSIPYWLVSSTKRQAFSSKSVSYGYTDATEHDRFLSFLETDMDNSINPSDAIITQQVNMCALPAMRLSSTTPLSTSRLASSNMASQGLERNFPLHRGGDKNPFKGSLTGCFTGETCYHKKLGNNNVSGGGMKGVFDKSELGDLSSGISRRWGIATEGQSKRGPPLGRDG